MSSASMPTVGFSRTLSITCQSVLYLRSIVRPSNCVYQFSWINVDYSTYRVAVTITICSLIVPVAGATVFTHGNPFSFIPRSTCTFLRSVYFADALTQNFASHFRTISGSLLESSWVTSLYGQWIAASRMRLSSWFEGSRMGRLPGCAN